jgi:hypothetical protein
MMQQERNYLAILPTILAAQIQGNVLNLNFLPAQAQTASRTRGQPDLLSSRYPIPF